MSSIISIPLSFNNMESLTGNFRQKIHIPISGDFYIGIGDHNISMTIDFGDGTPPVTSTNQSYSLSHTYSTAGDYIITITGQPHLDSNYAHIGINMNIAEQNTKVIEIGSNIQWESCYGMFSEYSGDVNFPDNPDLSKAVSLAYMFYNTNFDRSVDMWSPLTLIFCTSVAHMFHGCHSLGARDINISCSDTLVDASGMFQDTPNFNGSISLGNTPNLADTSFMFEGATSFTGYHSQLVMEGTTDARSMFENASAFYYSQNFFYNYDLSSLQNMQNMFKNANSFNGSGISSCVFSNALLYMTSAFEFCSLANNQDFSNINTSNVIDMSRVFYHSSGDYFTQSWYLGTGLDSWDVSSVTDMTEMFAYCWNLNAPLNSWDVSSVTDMNHMFSSCFKFNQPLDSWDVSSVTDMNSMFNACHEFNQSLDSWNVSSVTDMNHMFAWCHDFNQPLNSWNVSSVTDMNTMFRYCGKFNQPLNSWNVSSVTDMNSMFIVRWDYSGTYYADFDQDLSSWDVSSVTDMESMFVSATDYDCDMSGWSVNNVVNCTNFANGSGIQQPGHMPSFPNCTP